MATGSLTELCAMAHALLRDQRPHEVHTGCIKRLALFFIQAGNVIEIRRRYSDYHILRLIVARNWIGPKTKTIFY